MELVIVNSDLDAGELETALTVQPGVTVTSVSRLHEETTTRGPLTDALLAVAENATGGVLALVAPAVWQAYRARRARRLRDTPPTAVRIEIDAGDSTIDTTLVLPDGLHEAAAIDLTLPAATTPTRLRITFPSR